MLSPQEIEQVRAGSPESVLIVSTGELHAFHVSINGVEFGEIVIEPPTARHN